MNRKIILLKEVEITIPEIERWCSGEEIDELCAILETNCDGIACDECIFSEQNFQVFKDFMNEKAKTK